MTNWQEQIQKGMELIKEGCKVNQLGRRCKDCPFFKFCDLMLKHYDLIPEEWEFEK